MDIMSLQCCLTMKFLEPVVTVVNQLCWQNLTLQRWSSDEWCVL